MRAKIAIARTSMINVGFANTIAIGTDIILYKVIATIKDGLTSYKIAYPMPAPTLKAKTIPSDNVYRMRSRTLTPS